jgi:hypothetical protein
MTEMLEAADWVYRMMKTDDDVNAVFKVALASRSYSNVAEFAAAEPERFLALYEACHDMVEQIPEHQLREGRQ